MSIKKQLRTVYVFAKLSTRRFFRDRLALFFGVIFPLIFLFIFGGIFGKKGNEVTFKVAVINQSQSQFAGQFTDQLKSSKVFKVDSKSTELNLAKEKMNRGQLDAAIILPSDFGRVGDKGYPVGQARVLYTQNNQQAAQTLATVLGAQFKEFNSRYVKTDEPFIVETEQTNDRGLSQFDYTFAGLLGFTIIGMGIFGPINVFPELKKQGVLRRLHTTPLRVWQYFTATAISQAIVGLFTMAVLFAVAMTVFKLKVVGNFFEIAIFLVFSIITILGIGLAVGGWAKNERQAAPLANIVVFPMLFLSGTFFPRFVMPEWLQKVSTFLPLTPVIDGIRLMATEGKHIMEILPQVGLMMGWLVVIYLIAFRVFRWE